MMPNPVRLLLVDDHLVVRKGLVHVLGTEADIEIVGEASSGEEALYLSQQLKPDVILMDIKMEGMGGIDTTRMIVQHHGSAKVIGLSTFASDDIISDMKDAGASGYLLKDVSAGSLTDTILRIHGGEKIFPHNAPAVSAEPEISVAVPVHSGQLGELGSQQRRVLALMTKGLTNPEIAEQLGISTPTARYHVSAILRKLDVSNRSEAVALAIQTNLVSSVDI
jgi:DNA-binding NarL/FixJ family response regulator